MGYQLQSYINRFYSLFEEFFGEGAVPPQFHHYTCADFAFANKLTAIHALVWALKI